jgi:hypothetical protein
LESSERLIESTTLDFSKNMLKTAESFCIFLNVVDLNIDDNWLINLNGLQYLIRLTRLSVKNNLLRTIKDIDWVKDLKLEYFGLEGNPVYPEYNRIKLLD